MSLRWRVQSETIHPKAPRDCLGMGTVMIIMTRMINHYHCKIGLPCLANSEARSQLKKWIRGNDDG